MSDTKESPEMRQATNLTMGLVMISLRMDALMAEFKPLAEEVGKGRLDGLAGRAPELIYLIGAKEALDSVIACLDDPMAGMRELEEHVSQLRFHCQVAQTERGI